MQSGMRAQDKTPVPQRTVAPLPEADKNVMAEKAARKREQMAAERVREAVMLAHR